MRGSKVYRKRKLFLQIEIETVCGWNINNEGFLTGCIKLPSFQSSYSFFAFFLCTIFQVLKLGTGILNQCFLSHNFIQEHITFIGILKFYDP